MKTTLSGGGGERRWCVAITVWQVARANSQRDRYRNLSRRRRREGNHGGMNWKENCRPEGDRGLYRTWERNCYPLRFSLRSVRGVKGIRSLSRRANSRLAELWGSHSRRDGRRARPRKFSTTFAK